MRSIEQLVHEGRPIDGDVTWPSGRLPGRANRVLVWEEVRFGIHFEHITDDGPNATPGERYWCEYFDRSDNVQACMAGTLRALVRLVREEMR